MYATTKAAFKIGHPLGIQLGPSWAELGPNLARLGPDWGPYMECCLGSHIKPFAPGFGGIGLLYYKDNFPLVDKGDGPKMAEIKDRLGNLC